MAKVKSGSEVKKGLKFFNYGSHGTWKSSFALDFAKMTSEDGKPLKVLYIDCETGSVDLYLEDLKEEGYDLRNILMIYTTSYSEVEEYAKKAIANEDIYIEDEDGNSNLALDAEGNPFKADVIVIDGLTVISDNVKFAAINVSEKRAKIKAKTQDKNATEVMIAESTAGLEFKDHDKIKMKGKQLLRNLITGTDKYVVVTSREKTKKKMTSVDGKMELVDVGIVPDTWDGVEYEFYTVLRHFEDEDGTIKAQVMRKDRTKVFQQNEIIGEPTPLYWQSVINSNIGKKTNVLNESVEASVSKDEQVFGKPVDIEDEVNEAKENKLETLDDYIKAIDEKLTALSKQKKVALVPKLKNANVPVDYKKIKDLEVMKKFYEIANE